MAKQAPSEPDDASVNAPVKAPPKVGSGIKVNPLPKKREDKGIFTQEDLQKYGGTMKNPPSDPEYGTPTPIKKAKGGSIDGCAKRGKTRGRMV